MDPAPSDSSASDVSDVNVRREETPIGFIQSLLEGMRLWAVVSLGLGLLLGVAVLFLLIEHPYRLLLAGILALPALGPLARIFFTSEDQFIEDSGLNSEDGILGQYFGRELDGEYGRFFVPEPTVGLNIVWFVVAWGGLLAAAYHVLGFIVGWFALPPSAA